MGLTAIALALAGVGYAAESLITDGQDVHAAIPLIKADGFSPGDVGETIGGGVIDISPLRVGKCAIDGVDAHLTYRDGKVVNVSNYEIPVDYNTVTVQNAAGLRRALPDLHC